MQDCFGQISGVDRLLKRSEQPDQAACGIQLPPQTLPHKRPEAVARRPVRPYAQQIDTAKTGKPPKLINFKPQFLRRHFIRHTNISGSMFSILHVPIIIQFIIFMSKD